MHEPVDNKNAIPSGQPVSLVHSTNTVAALCLLGLRASIATVVAMKALMDVQKKICSMRGSWRGMQMTMTAAMMISSV